MTPDNEAAIANQAYFAQLLQDGRQPCSYEPKFIACELSLEVYQSDIVMFQRPRITADQLQEYLAFMTPELASDKKLFQEAKHKELDQWVSNVVFKVTRRTGILLVGIMPMRWVLTWKEALGGERALARLFLKGFTDPNFIFHYVHRPQR